MRVGKYGNFARNTNFSAIWGSGDTGNICMERKHTSGIVLIQSVALLKNNETHLTPLRDSEINSSSLTALGKFNKAKANKILLNYLA